MPGFARSQGRYRVRFARTEEELDAILRLRFEVFNLEMGEGLEDSFETERDWDRFDSWCHHLLVEEAASDRVIGTYRMQTPEMAAAAGGFYSSGEFQVDQLPDVVLRSSVEVGRACIAREHRSRTVLFLLWMGLAAYMRAQSKRYLFGCCSLSSQDREEGLRLYRQLVAAGHLHPSCRVEPRPGFACGAAPAAGPVGETVEVPQLFATYLRYGAKILGPPAIDREFKTIDYFVLLDVEALDPRTYRIFFT
ncbi:MAG: GNAT family N-acyltransferase [Thermoanaerobaculia bacterium]|nr:GNAT family N-acyltransferase [Thermoanaerobaculia bacterium]